MGTKAREVIMSIIKNQPREWLNYSLLDFQPNGTLKYS